MAASVNAAAFLLTILVFSACVPRPSAMLVSLMAITPCASSASIVASVENFHQGANTRTSNIERESNGLNNPARQSSFHASDYRSSFLGAIYPRAARPHREGCQGVNKDL